MSEYKLVFYSTIKEIPANHQEFIKENDQGSIFLTTPWFCNLEKTVFEGAEVEVFILEDKQQQAKVILPCVKSARSFAGLKADVVLSLNNYYSSLFSPIIDLNLPSDQQQKLLKEFIGQIKSLELFDSMDFSQLDKNDTTFEYVVNALSDEKYTVEPYFCFGNWYLELNNRSFEEYWNNLPSKLRNTIKRRSRKLEREHTYRIELVTNETELSKYIDDYNKIYHKSWKKEEPYPNFVPGLVNMAAEQGWLRMGILYVNDIPAASQLWFIYKGTANIYKLAYDEDFSKYSVGSILSKYLFEYAIDNDKVHTIDYLTGDDGYKKDWMSHRRERWGIRAYNRSLFGLLNTVKFQIKKTLKKN